MPYEFTSQGEALLGEVRSFMKDHIFPNEEEHGRQQLRCHRVNPPL
jgi:hypothetical protein